jgi:hypothetical protein
MLSVSYSINNEDVSLERLNGETIILNFKTGAYYSCQGTGSDLFWMISNKVSIGSWRQILENYYLFSDDVSDGIVEFIQEALKEKIIHELNNSEVTEISLPDDLKRAHWTTPNLLKYNDVQHLLLVDPIHDSSLQGWPNLEENET